MNWYKITFLLSVVGLSCQSEFRHKEKSSIEKYFSPRFRHFKEQWVKIYFYAWFNSFSLHNAFSERVSQFSTMKRIETSPEEGEVNIDYPLCLNINW